MYGRILLRLKALNGAGEAVVVPWLVCASRPVVAARTRTLLRQRGHFLAN